MKKKEKSDGVKKIYLHHTDPYMSLIRGNPEVIYLNPPERYRKALVRSNLMYALASARPKEIIREGRTTTVFWKDGETTVVKRQKGTLDDPYQAFCAALAKKIFGSNSRLIRAIKDAGGLPASETIRGVKEYRKGSVTIKAIQCTGENLKEVFDFVGRKPIGCDDKNLKVDCSSPWGALAALLGNYVVKNEDGAFDLHWAPAFEEKYAGCEVTKHD
ncbi:MAG: hypothetical protein QM221_09330 [Bacillota bacterium]|nr:hypothetical protein [Bacillota bacterium]